ncbi:DnaJ domain-containing protein [Sorangium sp. So ce131]|uniref:DnaJ domain-containing protein n=1 Tax=Sorangium sp. So ce131 TaxID=3133282 RepID=UPI003F628EB8
MSEPSSSNHYATLGVERSADARAIKKAYFALIRTYPPESHPDEFKRIRAAYEVLSDAEARERYDAQEKGYREYEDAVAAALAAAEQASTAGDEDAAQAALRQAIDAHPGVLLLREKLAASYARSKDHERAIAALDALIERSPETARYHLLRALSLGALGKPDAAEEAMRKAHALAPDHEGIQAALVDALTRNEHADEALAILDEAAARHDASSLKGVSIQLRRVHVLYQSMRPHEAEEAVQRLVEQVRASGDPELPKHVASELGAPAAALFAADRSSRANNLLSVCRALHPESLVLRPYPSKATLETSALPPAALEWLAEQERAQDGPTLRMNPWGSPLKATAGAGALSLIAYLLLYSAPAPATEAAATEAAASVPFTGTAAGAIVMAALLGGVALLLAHVARVVHVRRKSPIQGLTTVHPLYLVRADPERTELYPLFCLSRSEGVHHGQNGVYSHTVLRLGFGGAEVSLTFLDGGFAQAWLDHLLATRKRALELLAAGYLDAEHGVELLPPTQLDRPPPSTGARLWAQRRRLAAAAGVALVLWVGAMVSGARYADELAFRDALTRDAAPAYDAYLRARPDGRFADDARRALIRRRERGAEALALALDRRAPGAEALAALGHAVEDSGARVVPLSLAISDGGARVPAGDADAVFGNLGADLGATLAQAGLRSARIKRAPGAGGRSGEANAIEVDCTLTRGAGAGGSSQIDAAWKVRVVAGGAERRSFAVTTSASAAGAGPESGLAGLYAQFLRALLADLGLGGVEELRRQNAPYKGSSPYGN